MLVRFGKFLVDFMYCEALQQFSWRQLLGPTETLAICLQNLILNAAFAPFTFLLNAFVLVLLYKFRTLRTNSNLILGSMACSDAINGLLAQPLKVTQEILFLRGIEPYCQLEDANMFIGRTNTLVSLMIVTIINIERYISLKYTLRHRVIVTSKRLAVALTGACLVPIILNIASSIDALSPYNLYGLVIVPAVSVSTTIYCFCVMMSISRRHQMKIMADHIATGLPREQLKFRSVGSLFTILTTLRLFTYVLIILSNLFKERFMMFGPIAVNVALVISFINPIVYCAKNQSFKQAAKTFLGI
ncbi:predicted protein [Nematostella vectensis]|uniref:G-protein coupled receptors family 1 profile domain-containing protein n=1 Tax=Nematostella vectensis TaxID=45351 RepID=A7RVJ8_NEMVE|nr:predicted protein [Nematostella vectensis]|eukprot:XP_001636460.1 predicted protein [Nematostella vectensis]